MHGYQVIFRGEPVQIPYPERQGKAERGRSFHHGRFIMNLRKAAQATPNVTVLEATVSSLVQCPVSDKVLGVRVSRKKEGDEKVYFGDLTMVADGCFSKFRKQFIEKEVLVRSNFVGMVLKDAPLPAPNHGHVVLSDTAPILLYQIGTHDTRILIDVPGKLPSVGSGALKSYLETNVRPNLPANLRPSFDEAIETERLRSMPNSFLPPSTNKHEGLIMIGDAMNMRHPLTGGGMTVAFNDVVQLQDLLSPANVPSLAQHDVIASQMEVFHWRRKHLSSVINILAQALYSLFAANDENLDVLKQGCFGYFKRGGECVNGPVGLLAGITPQPLVLVYHFFSVALYSIYLMFANAKHPILEAPKLCVKSVTVFYTACVVLLPVIFSEMQV